MTQAILSVGLFLGLLALLPLLIKWVQRRVVHAGAAETPSSRVVSAVAVGPHQKVVTVEVGPPDGRVWLVLGVTSQSVSCLHSLPGPDRSGPEPLAHGATLLSAHRS